MQNSLASDILKSAKKKATFWKVATIVAVVIEIAELLIIMN